jgi:hypothetical protein
VRVSYPFQDSEDENNEDEQNINDDANNVEMLVETVVDPATLSVITKDDRVVEEPNLIKETLRSKHRKNTKYRYSNQPSRFKSNVENIMNYLHLRLGHASDGTIKKMVRENIVKLPNNAADEMIEKVQSTPC